MANSQAIEVDLVEESGISLKSSYESLGRQVGGREFLGGPCRVKNVLSKFMNEIEEQNKFLMAWNKILDDYDIHENSWMKCIFAIKEKWAYAYVRHEWSAGMNTKQLSEIFNANLKDYLKSDLNIAQFFIQFERVVNDIRYKELEAEYDL
ncbi:hypothetical protein Dsin_032314 [Dipteronia sinensis]|uniref:Protein FAR1-RELATED SEQUENCE n=1 Tax=Dipteronia sinensis TaxID=43782 RepID=A0AAE0DT23_9ROSI|nr:hypothetical protein Dsin_032314 [Dipteronia sinensis]